MKCVFVLATLALVLCGAAAENPFAKCVEPYTNDEKVRARIYKLNMKETATDKNATRCVLKLVGVVKDGGDMDLEMFKILLKIAVSEKLDYSMIKATNANQPTFQAEINAFIAKNRAALLKAGEELQNPQAQQARQEQQA